jgi:tetratricopeptide (TPR) repeat protein
MYRTDARKAGLVYDHAHNEYLEALVEGGLVRLALSVLTIGLVFWLGGRAYCRRAGHPAGGLALGALVAFTTLVLHSAVEFGLHIPAIAVLATVVCAHLSGLGGARVQEGGPHLDLTSFRLGGWAPLAGAVVLVLLGVVLWAEGRKAERVWKLERAAARWREAGGSAALERRLAPLTAAARLDPSNARVEYLLGEASSEWFAEQIQRLNDRRRLSTAAETLLSAAPAGRAAWVAAPTVLALARVRETRDLVVVARLALRSQVQALGHYLRARDLCPLDVKAHLGIAVCLGGTAQSEARGDSLERARNLTPADPELWYRCGLLEVRAGQTERAWKSWRRSLELSDRYIAEILDQGRPFLDAAALLEHVLPDRPALLLRAAFQFYPQPADGAKRKPFLERALSVFARRNAPLGAADYRVKAAVHRDLGQPREAVAAYRAALMRDPGQVGWRYELAQVLYEQRQFPEARQELLAVLAQQPGHAQARLLLDAVANEIARNL